MPRSIEVEGLLQLSDGVHDIEVKADGSSLRAEIGRFKADARFLPRLRTYLKYARLLSRELDARNLSLVITADGKPLAELGSGVSGGPVARLLGVDHLRLRKR